MIALVGLGLLLLPRVPGHRRAGQRRLPGDPHRPARVPAGRVREDRDRHLPRQLPARHAAGAGPGARRFAGVTIPPLKHFGPLLVVWGAAMLMLFFIRDLGSSLMFFGGFLAMLYVATNRALVRGRRAAAVRARRVVLRHAHRAHVQDRIDAWQRPVRPGAATTARRQLPDRAVAVRAGRRRPVRAGLRRGAARLPELRPTARLLAAAGAAHRPHLRGDHQRARARRRVRAARSSTCCSSSAASRSRCSRATRSPSCSRGLTAVFALQVFVIVGGVTQA